MHTQCNKGFTLLELMISMVMIGIIVLIIAGAMRLGFRSVQAGERKIESLERTRTAITILDSQIQSQIPLTYDDEGVQKPYFSGSRESLQFTTNYSIWGGERGYVTVLYTVGQDDNGKRALYASENLVHVEQKSQTQLLNALDSIYFEYFYKDPTSEVGQWVEQWTDDTSIPEKVRINLIDGTKHFSMIIPMWTGGPITQVLSQQSLSRKKQGSTNPPKASPLGTPKSAGGQ